MAPLLDVRDLHTEFRTGAGVVRAVDGVSYTVEQGETVAIVGESGSGKSVGALSILRLIPDPPGRITRGQVLFLGRDLMSLPDAQMREVRGGDIGMVFCPIEDVFAHFDGLGLVGDIAGPRVLALLRDEPPPGPAAARPARNPDPSQWHPGLTVRALSTSARSLRAHQPA